MHVTKHMNCVEITSFEIFNCILQLYINYVDNLL